MKQRICKNEVALREVPPNLRFFIIAVTFLVFDLVTAQKLVEKTIINPSSKHVLIDGTNCFQLLLNTHQSPQVKVEATIEGEYAKDLAVKVEENGDTILISADFLPTFHDHNDKLSAHKVISIALKITLPEYMMVALHGTTTNVYAKGKYTDLSIILSDGNCTLNHVLEKATVKTQTGEIFVSGAKGQIFTKNTYGKVVKGWVPKGENVYRLETIEGLITINKNDS